MEYTKHILVIADSKTSTYRMMGCNSLYAVPTRRVRANDRKRHIDCFLKHAEAHPDTEFQITNTLGDAEEIAPMFALSPPNCTLPSTWKKITTFSEEHTWWG